jgi:hypothetical protein
LCHSGAGALLPLIGAACDASALVFVDAVVPALHGPFTIDGECRSLLDERAADDTLPPWPPPGVSTRGVRRHGRQLA